MNPQFVPTGKAAAVAIGPRQGDAVADLLVLDPDQLRRRLAEDVGPSVAAAEYDQVAVLSLGSIVTAERIPVGGEAVDHAIVQHLRHEHELMLPSQSVRPLQLALSGNGLTSQGPASTEIHGRDVATGLARSVRVDTAAVRGAIETPLTAVLDGIGRVLRDCPPDLVADLADRGIMMVGGSALLPGFDQMLRQATGMPVHIAERPDVCAVQGLACMLEGRIEPLVLDPLAT